MKFEVKYVEFNINPESSIYSEKFIIAFERSLNKYASNTRITLERDYWDEEKGIVKIALQKHIALSTFCNILNSIQNNSRVIYSSINYEYNTCRAVVNVKIC